jgi:predicted house-cleaning noncanonical NTP pyrophosphatase (MazG superfamily)
MKLIRHRLPDIAHAQGKPMRSRVIRDEATIRSMLAAKLVEEAGEFAADPSINELVDVYEAVQCLLAAHGWSAQLLEERWALRRRECGGFLRGTPTMGAIAYLGDPLQPGERVMVMQGNMDRSGPSRALHAEVIGNGARHGHSTDSFPWLAHHAPRIEGSCLYENEGVTWARGWSDETAGALAAAWALAAPLP